MISEATIAKFDKLVARCNKAGQAAARKKARELKREAGVVIVDAFNRKKTYTVHGYPYGFVNLHVVNGRSGFAQYLKAKDALGWRNSVYTFRFGNDTTLGPIGQSMAVQEAEVLEWQRILASKGIETYITDRID